MKNVLLLIRLCTESRLLSELPPFAPLLFWIFFCYYSALFQVYANMRKMFDHAVFCLDISERMRYNYLKVTLYNYRLPPYAKRRLCFCAAII